MITNVGDLIDSLGHDWMAPVEVNLDGYNFKIEKVELTDEWNDTVFIHLER